MKFVLRLTGAIVLLAGATQSLRIGYADYLSRKDTKESIQHALTIWANDGDFYARLADLDSTDAIPHLRIAVALNQGLSKSWIALGLRLEMQGSIDEAERCYLEAASRDRQFLPAWTLANFYSRRSNPEQFWPWARHAAAMSYDDISPLLRLAFGFTDSSEVVLAKIIVPRRKVEDEFLYYLISEKLDASAIAGRILSKAEKKDLPPLFAWMNRLIEAKRISEARGLWDALSDKRLINYPRLALLTNADFSSEPLPAFFDWRITSPAGVDCERMGGGLRIQFSGKQPEAFELASQYLNVTGGTYVLWFEYRTVDIVKTTNLRWRLGDVPSEPLAAAESWTHASRVLTAGPVNRLILLEMREPGTTRPEGVVYLRGLHLTPSNEVQGGIHARFQKEGQSCSKWQLRRRAAGTISGLQGTECKACGSTEISMP